MSDTPRLVRDVMSRDVATVDPNDVLVTVDGLQQNRRIRHLPVVDEEGLLVGLVTQRDVFHSGLLKAAGYGTRGRDQLIEQLLVKEVMVSQVTTTTADMSLSDAAALMVDKKIGCLPVMDGDKLVGILTESDFVKLACE